MPRYIDADALIKDTVCNDPVRIAVMCAPSADVAPVVHGWWQLMANRRWSCSVCGGGSEVIRRTYCRDCGAKMDAKEGDRG